MQYRPEIDGLRAVAVIPVILFHAGVETFSGGFVGVDVFFVISGYLITSIIVSELNAGTFTLKSFYERRARRILPALFFVIACCIPVAWFTLTPNDMKDFAQSVFAAATFSSNILFWRESGYFATAAELKPLLHTWSLAVEEQYYIIFPLFMIIAWRYFKASISGLLAVIFVLSFALSQYAAYNHPTANFYLLPTRGWELLVGVFVALYIDRIGFNSKLYRILTYLGIGAILIAIFSFNEHTPFPSVYTLLPTVGAALIIIGAKQETLPTRLLRSRIAVGIGLVSYSLYLWHQPLFAFARVKSPTEPTLAVMIALSAAAMALAATTWWLIEQPLRLRTKKFKSGSILMGAFLSLTLFATAGLYGHIMDGFKYRFEIAESVYSSIARTDRAEECFDLNMVHERDDWYCTFGDDDQSTSILVFGDSHSLSFLPAIDDAATKTSLHGVFIGASGCTPLLGIHALRSDQNIRNCHMLNNRVLSYASNNDIDTVFLVARWSYYTDGGYSGDNFSYIALEADSPTRKTISREAFEVGLRNTIESYEDAGIKLILVPQVPQQRSNPLEIYARAGGADGSLLEQWSVSVADHEKLQSFVKDRFEAHDTMQLDFSDVLCSETNCAVGTTSRSYYYDDDHLSLSGSQLLVPKLVNMLSASKTSLVKPR